NGRSPLTLEPLPGRPKRRPPRLPSPQRLGQLITTRIPITRVLLSVDALSLLEDLGHDRLIAPVAIPRGARAHPRPIDRDLTNPHQPRLPTESEHRHKQLPDRMLVPATELRDRRMIRDLHRRDHLERHIP